jgi:hypothetical protein
MYINYEEIKSNLALVDSNDVRRYIDSYHKKMLIAANNSDYNNKIDAAYRMMIAYKVLLHQDKSLPELNMDSDPKVSFNDLENYCMDVKLARNMSKNAKIPLQRACLIDEIIFEEDKSVLEEIINF